MTEQTTDTNETTTTVLKPETREKIKTGLAIAAVAVGGFRLVNDLIRRKSGKAVKLTVVDAESENPN